MKRGDKFAPLDRRYIKKPCSTNRQSAAVRGDVVTFLQRIYESVAETMPDCRDTRDDTQPDEDDLALVRRNVLYDLADDSYRREMNRQMQPDLTAAGPVVEAAGRAATPSTPKKKATKRSVQPLVERTKQEERFLPPGRMMQWWLQYKVQAEASPPASFVTF